MTIPWERMQKLLALADGTEHAGEAANATARLQEIMVQHQLLVILASQTMVKASRHVVVETAKRNTQNAASA